MTADKKVSVFSIVLRKPKTAITLAAIAYSTLGWLFDFIPFPGTPKSHFQTIAEIQPAQVSDSDLNFWKEVSKGDGFVNKEDVTEFCNKISGDSAKVKEFNQKLVELKASKRKDIRPASWNLKGCN